MDSAQRRRNPLMFRAVGVIIILTLLMASAGDVLAESSIPQTDQTPVQPLNIPNPGTTQPRYISGFGTDNTYTIFYEDRLDVIGCAFGSRIYFVTTTNGPLNLSAPTITNICDTHLIVKDWPITIGANTYAYRAWGSHGNDPLHTFYVSNNMITWTTIYLGVGMFSDPTNVLMGDTILYGFHDIIQINNNYIGFVESAGGSTYIAWSDLGDQSWTIMARVGGAVAGATPLNLYFFPGITGPIPSSNFILQEIDGELTYTKLMVPGDRRGAFMAINRAAAQAATPALAEVAFMNPANWTWRDGTFGVLPGAADTVLSQTAAHDIREVWSPPPSDPRSDHVIFYTANYAAAPFTRGLGCAAANTECLVQQPPAVAPEALPATGFTPGRITALVDQPQEKAFKASDIWLEIPAIGVNTGIVGVPYVDDNWDVSWLNNQVGYLEGTAFPTWTGNSVLTGHVYNASGLPGPFVALQKLTYGDQIILHAFGNRYIYEVRMNLLVKPDDLSPLKHEDLSWVALITCKGYDRTSGSYTYRRVVRAVLILVEPES